MKQPIELGIMVVMAAMMVFATTAYVMPSVYAATSSSGQGAACDPSSCKGTPGYYTTVIITALMDHLDALVQIHTNAQLGQLAQSQGQILQSQGQILQSQGQLAQSQQGTNFFSFSR
jgi:hypothetical protein